MKAGGFALAALFLIGCGDSSTYGGITDQQQAILVDQCLASRERDPECASRIAGIVAQLEAMECPYPEVARAVAYGLTPVYQREGELVLDCPRN